MNIYSLVTISQLARLNLDLRIYYGMQLVDANGCNFVSLYVILSSLFSWGKTTLGLMGNNDTCGVSLHG